MTRALEISIYVQMIDVSFAKEFCKGYRLALEVIFEQLRHIRYLSPTWSFLSS